MAKRSSLFTEPSCRGEGCLLPWAKHFGEMHGGHVAVLSARAYLRARFGHPHSHLITCQKFPSHRMLSAPSLPAPLSGSLAQSPTAPEQPPVAAQPGVHGRISCRSLVINGKIIAAMIRNSSTEIKELIAAAWKECPNCEYHMHNDDVSSQWPGLPVGVKFDPTDQELIGHLEGKVGRAASHVLIDNFIPMIKEEEGICYTHPKNLPGIKMDGSSSYFFHKISNAYEVGKRKRRKISNSNATDCDEKMRWHKTGKSSRILDNGVIKGWKKILVLHKCYNKKRVKTNWTMHQCHLGAEVGEKHGELVVSKVFWQVKNNTRKSQMHVADVESGSEINPTTPNMYPPQPRRLSGSPLETEQNQDEEEPGSSAFQGNAAPPPLLNTDIHENPTPLNFTDIEMLDELPDLDSILLDDSLDWLYENEAWRKEEEHRSEEGSEVTAQRRETAFPCDV
ncbi:SUPPRESSOR OF GAMMA RESPONSE 1-like [Lolium rigidum]|uniref:SUPPRESSOR OF GAMMA RESPONSE 1-like n=1 Tax=Lolium rigidum TaxID=89674 RepID=UPI001F5CDBCB|nr:SUPPRESSOR OF GAMMA RESPONSE 1-like [Lolium rigidum]